MSIIQKIRERLAVFEPLSLDIEDDSALHAGHAGARTGGGHYRLKIVSSAFAGKNTLNRHRMIYHTLGEMMNMEIHALAICAQTAEEASMHPTQLTTL